MPRWRSARWNNPGVVEAPELLNAMPAGKDPWINRVPLARACDSRDGENPRIHSELEPAPLSPELLQLLNFCALKPHNLRTSNIGIREERFNDRFIGHRVEVQDGEYFSAAMVSAQRHVRNIYRVRSENGADLADNSRDVMILQQKEDPNRSGLDMAAVDPNNSGRRPDKGSGHRDRFSMADRLKFDQIREFAGGTIFGFDGLQSQGLRE